MATSQAELYALAVSAGLTPARAKTAAAIAMAESGGNARAHNTKGLDNSYGYWQINMKGRLGPPRLKQFGISSADQLFDPATNARAMSILSKQGADFRPWSTYLSGSYLPFLANPVGGTAGGADAVDAGFHLPGIPDVTAPFRDFGQIVLVVLKSAAWVSNSENWVRVGYVLGGTLVVLTGVSMVLKDSSAGRQLVAGAKTAAKVAIP